MKKYIILNGYGEPMRLVENPKYFNPGMVLYNSRVGTMFNTYKEARNLIRKDRRSVDNDEDYIKLPTWPQRIVSVECKD